MKIEYLSEVPNDAKRKYTKWQSYLAEFWKTDEPVMKLTVNPDKDGKTPTICGSIKRCVGRCGYRMRVFYRKNIIIVEKVTD